MRRLTQLCFGSANDCVRLALDPAAGPEGLDLGQLAEIKRTEKGAVEIKLIDRLQALSQLAALLEGGQDAAQAVFRSLEEMA